MHLLDLSLPGLHLKTLCIRELWGATFEDALFVRHDGSYQLRQISDHPEFEDETFDLTSSEGQEWMEHQDGRDW